MPINYNGIFGNYGSNSPYGSVQTQYPPIQQTGASGGFLENHPGVVAGVAGLSNYLSGLGQQDQIAKQNQTNVQQDKASMLQRMLENNQNNQRLRATTAAEMDPLGSSQMFAAKNALISRILGGAKNISYSPGDAGIKSAMGSHTLPSIPNFSPADLEKYFGDNTTQTSIAQRQKAIGQIDPYHPVFNMHNMFGDNANGTPNSFFEDVLKSNKDAQVSQQSESALTQQAIMQALAEMQKNAKGPGLGSKILGALPSIGLTALSFL